MTRSACIALALLAAACAKGQTGDDVPGLADAAPSADGPDATAGPDAPPAFDAEPPDAGIPPSEVASLYPGSLAITRDGSGLLTVTLDHPALAGGAVVTLETDDTTGTTLTIPPSVTVPQGQSSTQFAVTGVAVGGPFDVRASLGVSVQASSIVVVPALLSVGPATTSDVTVGTTATYTVTLEAPTAGAVDVNLSAADPGLVTIPALAAIPAGSASGTFSVTGLALGGPVLITASIGTRSVTTTARVVGLYLSEVLYDVTSTDTNWEWIELYNASPVPIDVTGLRVQVANMAGPYVNALTLTGSIPVGGCEVIGGPNTGATNYTDPATFVFFYAGDFTTDLGNAGSATGDPGDGLSLTTTAGDVIDNVIYGRDNSDGILDENGVAPAAADVGDAPAGQSIERSAPGLAGPWVIQTIPNPGNCSAIAM